MRKLAIILSLFVSATAFAGRGASLGSIRSAIRSGNADVIISELERAEKLICARCVAEVLPLLDNDDYRVREVAAWWVAKRPMLRAAVTMQSLARLSGSDARAAEYAADVLGTLRHPDALPALGAALARNYPGSTKAAVVRAVGTIGDPRGESIVVAGLADGAAETRAAAARAYLELRGSRDGAPLVGLLTDGDAAVRREAATVVGNTRTAAARAALEAALANDTDPLVRRNAAWALSRLGDPASRGALQRAADSDPVSYVRSVANTGLNAARQ